MELEQHPQQPWSLFDQWFTLAQKSEPGNPEAMSLATVGADQVPQLRTVLLKQIDPAGLVFFTNSHSTKGKNMAHNPEISLLFYWRTLDRQIRINGRVQTIDAAEADAYFASRPRISQIGAWASQQSRSMRDPTELYERITLHEQRFAGAAVPRPPYWWGYRLAPRRFEFWIQQEGRLHQRMEYTRTGSQAEAGQDDWQTSWLYP